MRLVVGHELRLWRVVGLFLVLPALLAVHAAAQSAATASKMLLVVPFENISNAPGLEWIGEAFPEILGKHPLSQAWAFKGLQAQAAVDVHADDATVSVNFWVTPDDANLDPKSGGLVIWDKAAPLDWDWAKYNADTTAAREFLAHAGARSVTVPYRSNRAVIFDSNLFHETDRIVFKEGYVNRRINITLLYGSR